MTAKKARVLWIDDQVERSQDADNLCDDELVVEFKCAGLDSAGLRALAKYDLLLIDYRLDDLPSQSIPPKGPAMLGVVRSMYDDKPAYLVSAHAAAGGANLSGLSWFEEFIPLADLQDVKRMRRRLKDDIAGYRAIAGVRRGSNPDSAIVDLLRVPMASRPFLLEAVPSSVKEALVRRPVAAVASGAPEIPGRLGFARWVRRVLLQKPGPLLPALHGATRVGMRQEKFRMERAFGPALYAGIFSRSYEQRWWCAALDEIVFEHPRRSGIPLGPPWELGPKVFRLRKADMPRCAVCDELQPDVVAHDIDTGRPAPVHQRHSSPAPQRDFTPFFAEERVYQ